MYLNPPCNDLQELLERINNSEVFKVFKRPVNERNRDRTNKKQGTSRVTLGDGMEVIVEIFNGSVRRAAPFVAIDVLPKMRVVDSHFVKEEYVSFSEFINNMAAFQRASEAERDRLASLGQTFDWKTFMKARVATAASTAMEIEEDYDDTPTGDSK